MRTGLGERMKTDRILHRQYFVDVERNAYRFDSFVTTPGGFMGKREPQTILKTDERSIHLELGRERTFNRQINRLGWKAGVP